MPLSDAQTIECFHLSFLQVLTASAAGKAHVLKGGANLRYFFDSVRYSEDIDLDSVWEPETGWKLKEGIDGILNGRAMPILLRPSGITIADVTDPKQTDTTRRWKVQLQVPDRDDRIGTKIEFSNRNGDHRHQLDAVPERIVEPYAVRPPTVRHYLSGAAITQKVLALAERNETQARDVFDLDHLFRNHPHAVKRGEIEDIKLRDAVTRAVELHYEAFADQVLPFLDPDIADLYGEDAWEQIQLNVIDRLEALR